MGDDNHGHAIGGELLHHLQHLLHHLRIEGTGGFVKQHQARLHAERTGDGDPLLLAAGELAWKFVGLLTNANPLQQLQGFALHLGLGSLAHQHRRQGEVVEHAQVREQVELLEHHPHLAANGLDVAGVLIDAEAIDRDGALLEILQGIEGANEGAFAGSGGAHDHHHFTAVHGEVHPPQGVVAIRIPLLDTPRFENGVHHSRVPRSHGDRCAGRGRRHR